MFRYGRRAYSTAKPLFPTKTIRSLLSDSPQSDITLRGWVRSVRQQKQLSFATINDGSTLKGIQVILNDAASASR
jgi:asparaginyl-tRNA synthetase